MFTRFTYVFELEFIKFPLIISFLNFHRAAEFVIYKLKEMGKITEDDISPVLDEFENLDVDQSGTLSISDITLSQSS